MDTEVVAVMWRLFEYIYMFTMYGKICITLKQ